MAPPCRETLPPLYQSKETLHCITFKLSSTLLLIEKVKTRKRWTISHLYDVYWCLSLFTHCIFNHWIALTQLLCLSVWVYTMLHLAYLSEHRKYQQYVLTFLSLPFFHLSPIFSDESKCSTTSLGSITRVFQCTSFTRPLTRAVCVCDCIFMTRRYSHPLYHRWVTYTETLNKMHLL